MKLSIPISTPLRKGLSTEERWHREDAGLIACWERGRQMALEKPSLARAALAGELPSLPWKGGVEQEIKASRKYGSMNYLAMWQGLRGEDLSIDTSTEPFRICAKFGLMVLFTSDISKLEAP